MRAPTLFRPAFLLAACVLPLLSACGSGSGGKVQSASAAVPRPGTAQPPRRAQLRAPVRRPPPVAQVQALPGLEGVMGSTAADLTRQFGVARLDVWEGDARKLQFSGTPCVLDIFLYPPAQGREPQATYIDARTADGRDVDRLACVTALRRR